MLKTYLPIQWKAHLPVSDFGVITFLKVEFLSEFGPFHMLEEVAVLEVDFMEGRVSEKDDKGATLRECKFFALPERRTWDRRGTVQPGGRRVGDNV